jgi:hypothetical protein
MANFGEHVELSTRDGVSQGLHHWDGRGLVLIATQDEGRGADGTVRRVPCIGEGDTRPSISLRVC